MSTTALVGATIRPDQMGVATQHEADLLWKSFGLPAQAGKTFYSTMGSYPTSIPSMEQTMINDGVGMIPVFKPTWPKPAGGWGSEVTALINYVNILLNAGASVPCICLYNELNSGKIVSGSQYLQVALAFQPVRNVVPLYIDFSGYQDGNQASYWDATLHDGIGVDYYEGAYAGNNQKTIDQAGQAFKLAEAANCPVGIFEMGNNNETMPTLTTVTETFKLYMAYMTNVVQTHVNNGYPMGPVSWWNGSGPTQGAGTINTSVISNANDARIPYVKTLFAATTSAPVSPTAPYDVGSANAVAAGTTLVVDVGSGSVGTPQGTSAGDLVYVLISATNSSQTISNVIDSQGNSYSAVNSYSAGSSQNQWLYASKTTTALVAGTDTITITYGTSTGNKSAIARGCPGVASATPDKAVVANGNNTTPSSGATSALTVSQELVVGSICTGGTPGNPKSVSFGTEETLAQNNYLTIFDEEVTTNAAVTASGVLNVSGAWSAMVTTFELSAATPTVVSPTSVFPVQGVAGTPGTWNVRASGGTKPYTWAQTGGTLPSALTFASNGQISGTPAAAGTTTGLIFEVTDNNGATAFSNSLSLIVNSSSITITTGSFTAGTLNAAYSASETVSGGTGSGQVWSIVPGSGALPTGLTMSSGGAITGTPTVIGTFTFEVTVTDSGGNTATSGVQSIAIDIPGGVNTAISAIAIGVPGVSSTGHDKGVIAAGSSTAPSATTPTLSQGEEFLVSFLADTNTGGTPSWASPWSTHVLGNQADGGSHVRLSAAYEQVNATTGVTASATITSAPWTIAIVTDAVNPPASTFVMSDGIVSEPYSQTLEATGGVGTLTWTKTGTLPPGTSLSAGVISGTPTTAGTYTFAIVATDTNSVAVTVPQTVTIAPSATSVATLQPMSGNLLSAADTSFETGIGTWASSANASSLAQTSNTSLVDSHSLRWLAAADGSTSITTGYYAVQPNAPYVVSGSLLGTSQNNPNFWIGVNWYTSGNSFISSSNNGGASMLAPLAWQGVQAAFVAPSNAAKAEVVVTVDAANKGDTNYLDLTFLASSEVQILIDFVNPAYGANSVAGQNFADVSPWARLDQGISMTRGRQDAISEVSTGQTTFNLQNDGGWFTKLNENSLAVALGGQVTLQSRCQVNFADENGAWYTRFDGQVAQIGYTLDPTGNTNLANFSISDILAPLSRQDSLQNWTKEQVLADEPEWHWTLDDAPSTTTTTTVSDATTTTTTTSSAFYTLAAEGSGNQGPPLKITRSAQAGAAALAWSDTTGGVETLADAFAPGEPDGSAYWADGSTLPGSPIRGLDSGSVGPLSTSLANVYFTPKILPGTAKNAFTSNTGYMLQAQLPTALNPNSTPAGDFAVEAWFTIDPSVVGTVTEDVGPFTVFSLGSSRRGSDVLVAGVFQPTSGNIPAAGAALYGAQPAFQVLNFPGAVVTPSFTAIQPLPEADTITRPHHLVVSVEGSSSGASAFVYVDGTLQGTIGFPPGVTFDTITVGGAYGGGGCHFGAIQLVSVYPNQLSMQQITLHCQLGQYGMWELPTDDCVAQLANYADIPAFWNGTSAQHNGLSLTDYFDITGNNAYSAMTIYEQTENGLLFVNSAGQLTFHTRDVRMGYTAPKLSLPPDSYSPGLGLSVLDTYQANEDAVASAAFPGGASYVNQASQNQFGTYATNPVGSPAQLAHISYSRGYGQAGLQEQTFWPDPNMLDASAWPANSKSDPWLSEGSVVVDMLTVDPSWGVNISDFYSVEIDDVVTLGGTLPASFANAGNCNEGFIEGIAETYQIDMGGQSQRTVTYYLSPAASQRGWIPGDSTYGVLSSTARLGISAVDLSDPQADGKDVSHDAGPPYWPPTFSSTMNSPAGNTGFVGMNDVRGLVWPLQQILQPPMAVMAAVSNTQAIATNGQDDPQLFWDTLYADSANGMGILPGWPNWYVCTVPGFYEIDGQAVGGTANSGGDGWQAWIVVAQGAAQAVVNGIAGPDTVNQYVCPVGESVRQNTLGTPITAAPTTRMYLGLGDMITLAVEQGSNASQNTNITLVNSALSLRFCGLGTVDDRAQINSSLNNGGSVSTPTPISHGTNTYQCAHTFSHYGQGASRGGSTLANKDGDCWQGNPPGGNAATGPQFTLIRFPWAQMQTDLSTKVITSVTLHGNNLTTGEKTGVTLFGGYYYTNNEGATWAPNSQSPGPQKGLWTQQWLPGKSLTFSIPASQFQTDFITNMAHGIMLGTNNSSSYGQAHYGSWAGGPNSWTLKVSF